MDFATLIGIVSGAGIVTYLIRSGGDVDMFINFPSLALTIGGPIAAAFIHYRLSQVLGALRVLRSVFMRTPQSPIELTRQLVAFTERARRDGLLALEDEAEAVADPFLRNGLQMVVDGTDPELIRNVMETELAFQQERHQLGQAFFRTLAEAAPAFGMLGTLIGLVRMLQALDNPENIGPGLAMALLTTLYGVLVSHLVFAPIAGKLHVASQEELLFREMAIEGVLSIQAGDNPRVVEQKLRAFLAPKLRAQMDREQAAARSVLEEEPLL